MRYAITAAVIGLIWNAPANAADAVKLANIEWPPYSSKTLPEYGATSALITAAFSAVGVDVTYVFLPFKRAVIAGTTDPEYAGYTTEYYSEDVASHCHLSKPVGVSPVGFAKPQDSTFTWKTIDDLANTVIGVVDGYVNDDGPFDAAMAAKKIKVELVSDDLMVLRKIAHGRTPIGVVDANVLAYLQSVNTDIAGVLKMDDHLLKNHDLFVCFQKTATGESLRNRFNEGLAKLNVADEYARYLKTNIK
jgi:polar amino acid transport system substrate-binding protein